jgi:hypothetical protein
MQSSRPKLGFVCLVMTLLLWAAPAEAQRIVVLRPRTADPALLQAFGRLKGELMSHDFEVVVLDADDAEPSPRRLARAAEQANAVASVSLVRSEGLATADVWISDRVTGKTTMRTIATAENRESSSVLAVRAVDLLRTSLREFPTGERPPPDVVGASPERAPQHVHEWAAGPTSQRWSVDAGVVLQTTLSSLGSVYGPSIALGYNPSERVGVAFAFQGPLSGAGSSTAGASLSLRNEQLFGEFRYRPLVHTSWSIETNAAVGAHRVEVEGTATPPYTGRSDSAWTALVAAGFGFELRLARNVALFAVGRVVFLAPRPVVRMAGTELSYGRPAVQTGVNLRVNF